MADRRQDRRESRRRQIRRRRLLAAGAAVGAAGYVGATTKIPGYTGRDKPYELARFEILGSSGASGLAEDLSSR